MVQILSAFGLKGTGIVAVLIIAGIALTQLNVEPIAGAVAINGGITIGIILGLLGVVGVVKRVF